MKITGTFESIKHKKYRVDLQDSSPNVDIQTVGENGLFFTSDPVEITREISDLFQPIIVHSCSISYQTSNYQGNNLFTTNPRGVECIITDITNSGSTSVVFRGWVNPQVFNQGYTFHLDGFTVDCTSDLGSLQYIRYKDTDEDNYDEKILTAHVVTVKSILNEISNRFLGNPTKVWFDGSVSVSGSTDVFDGLSVDEYKFYGDKADSTMTYYQVMDKILRYLNLHAMQIGDITYLFNWKKLKDGNTTTWTDLGGQTHTMTSAQTINFTSAFHAASDTNITVDEAYNKVSVKAVIDSKDEVITDPMDSNDMLHLYDRQKYFEEYKSDEFRMKGKGKDEDYEKRVKSFNGFFLAVQDKIMNRDDYTEYKKHITRTDWYIQHVYNPNWKFYTYDGLTNARTEINDLAQQDSYGNYINQYVLPATVYANPCSCGMFKFGSVENKYYIEDNSPQPTIDMTPYLCISINGNGDNSEQGHEPTDDKLHIASPLAEYNSPQNGSIYSPSDDSVTNYLVISGELQLQSGITETASYHDIYMSGDTNTNYYLEGMVKGVKDDHYRYYTRRWLDSTYPNGSPNIHTASARAIMPPMKELSKVDKMQYNYSAEGDGEDKFSKLPVLECELTIGNKRLVEHDMDEYGNSQFDWYTIGEEPTESYVDESGNTQTYLKTTFTIGYNPKIGDYITNQWFEIQNTVEYSMNINAKGMAIPIKKSDNLSGALTFKILGPINLTWDNITRRHPSFWRHTKWYNDTIFVLSQTETIFIKNFSAKLYSSLGTDINKTGTDLLYTSAQDDFINARKAEQFDLITQPTVDKCVELGIDYKTCTNAFINTATGLPVIELTSAADAETAVAEELYVNHYYNEYHLPKIQMDGTFKLREDSTWRNKYHSNLLNKDFYIIKTVQDLKYDNAQVTFRET